jgi:ankyrin repeat protein
MWASKNGHLEVVKLLIEKDIIIDYQNEDGRTALYYQYIRKNIQIIKLFLQSKQYLTKIKGLKRKNISFNQFIKI